MTTDLRTILEEIYALDPELRTKEQELVPIIETLMKHDPSRAPDGKFVEELRSQLKSHAVTLSSMQHASSWSMRNVQFAFGGAVLATLILAPAAYLMMNKGGTTLTSTGEQTGPMFAYSVTKESEHAFGDLTSAAATPATFGESGLGRGGGGEAAAFPDGSTVQGDQNPAPATAGAEPANLARPQSGGGGGDAKMMIYPPQEMTRYAYKIDGDIPLGQKTVTVYKRDKKAPNVSIGGILKSFNVGAVDLGVFDGAVMDSVNFTQDKPYGYTVNVMLSEGAVNISQNWPRWPHPENDCQTDACFAKYRLTPSDIPADDVLIDIAKTFATDYKIDLSHYGAPVIDNMWRIDYENAADKTYAYVPESQGVIFPLLIDGKPVVDDNGSFNGISMGVSVREKKVTGVSGLISQKYLASDYAGVTNADDVKAYIDAMMNPSMMPMAAESGSTEGTKTKTVTVTLGAPTVGLLRTYVFDKNGVTDELIVPALIFPVKNVSDGSNLYRTSVVVPLAKEMLDRATQNRPIPLDTPMPTDIPPNVRTETK